MALLSTQEPEISEFNVSQAPERARGPKRKKRYLSSRKKKKISGRKCKICEKDPYPNYFFCPSCHHRIKEYDEVETLYIRLEE